MFAGPPTKNYTLLLNFYIMCSTTSRIKCTPFCAVTLPTKANKGIESSRSPKLKYFYYNFLFAEVWSGAAESNLLILS